MGWMHDTLHYFSRDSAYRRWHHNEITFGLVYAWSERFLLPLSHDEVVHGKGSLYGRMTGDDWRKRANLRALLTLQWTHPGKTLLFMGGELAQPAEWNHDAGLPWELLDDPRHAGMQRLVRDLNHVCRALPALHRDDTTPEGFAWVVGDDAAQSVFAFLRRAGEELALVVLNLTPEPRFGYRIGVPQGGVWREVLNSDAGLYGGSNLGNGGAVCADDAGSHGQPHALSLILPPLAGVILAPAA
jgi:1,4-alpha-glucan branching enzyme